MYIFIFLLVSPCLPLFLALCGDLINLVSRDLATRRNPVNIYYCGAMDGGTTLCMRRFRMARHNEIYIKRKATP